MEDLKFDYISEARNSWPGLVVLLLGLSAMIFMVWNYDQVNAKLSDQEMLAARVRDASAIRRVSFPKETDKEKLAQEVGQANAIILNLGLPWEELFEAFESSKQKDVAVLAIEPDAQKGLVRISGEAKSLDSLPAYLAYLQKISLFQEVVLLNHQIQEQDPQKPVRFMIQATWATKR